MLNTEIKYTMRKDELARGQKPPDDKNKRGMTDVFGNFFKDTSDGTRRGVVDSPHLKTRHSLNCPETRFEKRG